MGVNATPRVASASPYTGVIALEGSPWGTNFAVNRSIVRVDGLGAVERDPPARQIQPFGLLRPDAPHAQLVGEVRPAGERPPMPVDRFQPARGAGEEVQRGHEHQRKTVVQAPHPRPDQPHVVVERQPAHEHVARGRAQRGGHGPQRGEHVAVAEHHALGAAGAAGGVLKKRGRGLVEGRALPQPAVPVEPGHVEHRIEPWNLRGQQPRDPEGGGEGDEGPGPGVREDARVTPCMVFELARPRRRVDRHRDRSGHLHREEGREVVEAGGQHQRRGLARREPPVGEAGGDVLGALHQRGERDPRRLTLQCTGRSV